MDQYEVYDIAFENLSFESQLRNVKEHMLVNPSLLFLIMRVNYIMKK